MSAIFFIVWVKQVDKFYLVCTNITSAIRVCKRITCTCLITVANAAVNPHPNIEPSQTVKSMTSLEPYEWSGICYLKWKLSSLASNPPPAPRIFSKP